WWRPVGSRAAAPDSSATRSVRAGAARTTGLLLGARPLRMAGFMAMDSRCLDSCSPRVRMGSGALAVVSVRLGVARGKLGLLRPSRPQGVLTEREENAQWRDERESSASISPTKALIE